VNYGVSTTIWDRLHGTFQPSRERGHDQALEHHPIVLRVIERQRDVLGRERRFPHWSLVAQVIERRFPVALTTVSICSLDSPGGMLLRVSFGRRSTSTG